MKNDEIIFFTILFIIGLAIYKLSKSKQTMISKNFSYEEFEKSNTAKEQGIDNKIPDNLKPNISALVKNVLQPARDWINNPINISSGYRSKKLNTAIGGVSNSQHLEGEAADIVTSDNAKLFNYIKNNLQFDQLIWEYGDSSQPEWIHVSYKRDGNNRNQVLTIK